MAVPDTTSVRSLGALRGRSYTKGRGIVPQALWVLFSPAVFVKVWFPNRLRVKVLRAFGAEIGSGVLIRHDVTIQWPWKLSIGDNTWLGVGVAIANIDEVTIGSDVCISQQAFVCSGSHDLRSPVFEYDNGPVVIENGAWVCARAVVLRGVRVGANSVIAANAVAAQDVPPNTMVLPGRQTSRPIDYS